MPVASLNGLVAVLERMLFCSAGSRTPLQISPMTCSRRSRRRCQEDLLARFFHPKREVGERPYAFGFAGGDLQAAVAEGTGKRNIEMGASRRVADVDIAGDEPSFLDWRAYGGSDTRILPRDGDCTLIRLRRAHHASNRVKNSPNERAADPDS